MACFSGNIGNSLLRAPPRGYNSYFYDPSGLRTLGALSSGGQGGLGGIGGGGNPFGTGLGTMGGSSPFNSGVGGLNGLNWLGKLNDNQGSGVPFGRSYVPPQQLQQPRRGTFDGQGQVSNGDSSDQNPFDPFKNLVTMSPGQEPTKSAAPAQSLFERFKNPFENPKIGSKSNVEDETYVRSGFEDPKPVGPSANPFEQLETKNEKEKPVFDSHLRWFTFPADAGANSDDLRV